MLVAGYYMQSYWSADMRCGYREDDRLHIGGLSPFGNVDHRKGLFACI